LQGRTIANSHFLNISVTFGFAAVYRDSSFRQFHLDEITPVRLSGLLKWTTCDKLHPDFKIGTIANTDGWGNKLVTIFARHLDSSIMKPILSIIYKIHDFGSGQILATETVLSFAGICKNCAMAACPPGQILPKAPGHVNGRADAANVYSLNRRAVISKPASILETNLT
jgi:hypothetical protein